MATEAHEVAESAPGMPQLDFSTFPNQIFWLLVALVAIYLVLSRVALPRIGAVLAQRHGTITNDIAAAEELKSKAQDAEAAYNQALADARAHAQKIVADAKEDIKADLAVELEKADAQIAIKASEAEAAIAEIRASSAESVKAVATDTAKALVAALGGKADAKTVNAAIAAQLKG